MNVWKFQITRNMLKDALNAYNIPYDNKMSYKELANLMPSKYDVNTPMNDFRMMPRSMLISAASRNFLGLHKHNLRKVKNKLTNEMVLIERNTDLEFAKVLDDIKVNMPMYRLEKMNEIHERNIITEERREFYLKNLDKINYCMNYFDKANQRINLDTIDVSILKQLVEKDRLIGAVHSMINYRRIRELNYSDEDINVNIIDFIDMDIDDPYLYMKLPEEFYDKFNFMNEEFINNYKKKYEYLKTLDSSLYDANIKLFKGMLKCEFKSFQHNGMQFKDKINYRLMNYIPEHVEVKELSVKIILTNKLNELKKCCLESFDACYKDCNRKRLMQMYLYNNGAIIYVEVSGKKIMTVDAIYCKDSIILMRPHFDNNYEKSVDMFMNIITLQLNVICKNIYLQGYVNDFMVTEPIEISIKNIDLIKIDNIDLYYDFMTPYNVIILYKFIKVDNNNCIRENFNIKKAIIIDDKYKKYTKSIHYMIDNFHDENIKTIMYEKYKCDNEFLSYVAFKMLDIVEIKEELLQKICQMDAKYFENIVIEKDKHEYKGFALIDRINNQIASYIIYYEYGYKTFYIETVYNDKRLRNINVVKNLYTMGLKYLKNTYGDAFNIKYAVGDENRKKLLDIVVECINSLGENSINIIKKRIIDFYTEYNINIKYHSSNTSTLEV